MIYCIIASRSWDFLFHKDGSEAKTTKKRYKMEAYAVLETGGKQELVKVGDKIEIEKIAVEAGQEAVLSTVLALSDGTTLKVGAPYVEGASVTLAIDGHKRGEKVVNF